MQLDQKKAEVKEQTLFIPVGTLGGGRAIFELPEIASIAFLEASSVTCGFSHVDCVF